MERTVLLVEDDTDIRESVAEILEENHFDVVEAKNGLEALQRIKDFGLPCLVLLDMMMPIMSGAEFLDELRKSYDWRTIRVIICSAFIKSYTAVAYPGIVGILPKPFSPDDLIETVSKYC